MNYGFRSSNATSNVDIPVLNGGWCYVIVTAQVDPSNSTQYLYNAYVNGKQSQQYTHTSVTSMPTLVVGGTITSNVKFYKHMLSSTEILALSREAIKDVAYGLVY